MPRGAKPGERRGGRQKGTPNKVTKEVKELAKPYTAEALLTLAQIMKNPKSPEAARVSAANAILDRAWGKPNQPNTHDGNVNINLIDILNERIKRIEHAGTVSAGDPGADDRRLLQ